MIPAEQLETYERLLKVIKEPELKIGNVLLSKTDFKSSSKLWTSKEAFEQRKKNYKHLRAKFLIIIRLVRRYTRYHRESQYLISFINSRETYNKSRFLTKNKVNILTVMREYLEHFSRIQPLMIKLEKVLMFLEQSGLSIKTKKFQEIMAELYQVERTFFGYCVRMNELLRDSDEMISSGSYDSGAWDDRTLESEFVDDQSPD
jgi:hypothetical protein|mmetsp:Transcript_5782/g.6321  ORF Transcript_5782/g.6321 Transcript_5782/m.6321 type:complete len:203 (+) Transcript_5782:65-673(+)|eukprot:gene7738-8356_t